MWLDAEPERLLPLASGCVHAVDVLAHTQIVLVQRADRRCTGALELLRNVLQNRLVHILRREEKSRQQQLQQNKRKQHWLRAHRTKHQLRRALVLPGMYRVCHLISVEVDVDGDSFLLPRGLDYAVMARAVQDLEVRHCVLLRPASIVFVEVGRGEVEGEEASAVRVDLAIASPGFLQRLQLGAERARCQTRCHGGS